MTHSNRIRSTMFAAMALAIVAIAPVCRAAALGEVIRGVQPKMVKIYGAGGVRGLEAYQSGFVISPEGHIVTAASYVLDSDVITIGFNDGRKLEAKLLGIDHQLEIAVLKVDGADFPCFDLRQA